MNRKILVLSSALLISLMYGCGTYRLVDVTVDTEMETPPEITSANNISHRIAQYRNIVISYSSEYYEASPTDKPQSTTVLMSSKGMWITEIEREFLKKGFRVLSRQKYNELLREKGVNASKEAASLLGADMIVQINSLEYSNDASMDNMTKTNYKIYVSNSAGQKLMRGRESEANIKAIDQAKILAQKDVNNKAYMALLDCKMIDAKTGELILFYRNQIFKLKTNRKPFLNIRYLFELEDDDKWELDETYGVPDKDSWEGNSKGVNRGLETQIKIEMVRSICSDFVNRINQLRREGKQGAAASIPAQQHNSKKQKPLQGKVLK
jgi:phosphoribosyl-AMP cyclohydrolase